MKTALLVIDVQGRLLPAIASADKLLENCLLLMTAATSLGIPRIATEQNPQGLGPTVPELKPFIERLFLKTHFDACCETGFLEAIAPIDRFVVAGSEAHVCVLQTVLGLCRAHKAIAIVADAIGSRSEFDKTIAIQHMAHAGAEVVTTEMIVFEWLKRCDRPEFKVLLPLIRKRHI